ncbi:MAG: FHA domain-containing protein [Actinomycetota bacterium]|nr:FHA domain-containing protein [Actinomycetota bacterium]
MPPIVLLAGQVLFLLLLYLFVARAVRVVVRDVRSSAAVAAPPPRPPTAKGRKGKNGQTAAPGELVVHIPDGRPRVIPLDAHDVTFGRAGASTVVLDDPYVSDHHARVYLADGRWQIADLGSTNGTFCNQTKVSSPTALAPGDQLGIGKTVVQVRR